MEDIKVSGCIVTYNNEDTIEKCVASLLTYTKDVKFKLYISDNCSTDSTLDIIESKFPDVQIIRNKDNGGFGYGHNQVLPKIVSKYHFVINPDIYVESDTISELVRYMENHQDAAMITPRIDNIDGTQQYLPKRTPTIRYLILSKLPLLKHYRKEYTREMENFTEPTEVDFCTGCFFCIRTKIFRELQGFDKRFFMYFEDADLSRSVRQKSKIIFYPMANVFHEWHRENTRKLRGILRWASSMIKYFSKWGWRF